MVSVPCTDTMAAGSLAAITLTRFLLLLPGLLLNFVSVLPTGIVQKNSAKRFSIGEQRSVIRDPAV